MRFGEFVGNAPLKQQLSAEVDAGRFPQALVLEGETGSGKRTLAMQLARAAETGQTLHIDFSPLMALRERTHFHTLSPEKPGGGCAAALAYLCGRAHTMEGAPHLTGLWQPALIRVAESE